MVAGAQSRFTFLAADLLSAVQPLPTPLQKTRVRGFRRQASGQTSGRRRCRSIITPGSRGCGYKTVSGRHEWPNRDPLGEFGFEIARQHNAKSIHTRTGVAELAQGPDIYEFVCNRPTSRVDLFGLQNFALPTEPARQDDPEGPTGDTDDNFFTHWADDPFAAIGYIGSRPFVWTAQLIIACKNNNHSTLPVPQAPPQVGCTICPVNSPTVLPPSNPPMQWHSIQVP
jgi:hypothetical protein